MVTQTVSIKTGKSGDKPVILVSSPYNPAWNEPAKALGGRWDSAKGWWYFDARDTDKVRELCLKTFGVDPLADAAPEPVTVRVRVACLAELNSYRADVTAYVDDVWFAGRQIFRYGKLGDGCVIIAGGVSHGGSRKHPYTVASDDLVVEIRDLPVALVDQEIVRHEQRIAKVLATLDEQLARTDLIGYGYYASAWDRLDEATRAAELAKKREDWAKIRAAHAARRDAIAIIPVADPHEAVRQVVEANAAKRVADAGQPEPVDPVPALVAAIEALTPEQRQRVLTALLPA